MNKEVEDRNQVGDLNQFQHHDEKGQSCWALERVAVLTIFPLQDVCATRVPSKVRANQGCKQCIATAVP